MDAMIKIAIEKEAVQTVAESILAILDAGQEQKTLRKALDTFMHSTRIMNTNISGNVFNTGENVDDGDS
ncbi:MAG: hypothetical protein E3J37_09670 [Anaerolineales bacterium]|nr:MAG: hypothetical protein E3J37_09670 [Anaerolineales bacterium]